ncbi:MAG: glycoside hydrolase family 5 protein [Verrucomicrobiae bacterium]|nr:glycoside hydrolase family 5 protein [Verrucomicrobiae bacterium]
MAGLLCLAQQGFGSAEADLVSPPRSGASAFAINQRLGRGINILSLDPIWRERERGWFKREYFRLIREAGFSHVRINLTPFGDNPGFAEGKSPLRKEYLETLDWAIDGALAEGLLVVVDFHEFTLLGENPEAYKAAFLKTWEILAARLKNRPAGVLFELLNEPNSKLTPSLWNEYMREALEVVRKTNPNRIVVIGPGNWNNIDKLSELKLPADDTNIIVTVHYYSPYEFTHQGAAFAGRADKLGIRWGTDADRRAVISDFDRAQKWAEEHRRPIYLGEFGVYDKAPEPDRTDWLRFVAREAERRGWSWAYWQFTRDFVAFDIQTGQWVRPVLEAIIPPPPQTQPAQAQ